MIKCESRFFVFLFFYFGKRIVILTTGFNVYHFPANEDYENEDYIYIYIYI